MIRNSLNIPFLIFLIFLISKEIFSYESEKIVILCIISFFVFSYYSSNKGIFTSLKEKSNDLLNNYNKSFILKKKLENELKTFWQLFLKIEDQFIPVYFILNTYLSSSIKKFTINKKLKKLNYIKDLFSLRINNIGKIVINLYRLLFLNNFKKLKYQLYINKVC
jgi:hypothetical protein